LKIGILGAGQLGRMLALAGYPLGLEFRFFDANKVSPARSLGEFVNGEFNDAESLKKFANGLSLVTTEFENIDIAAVKKMEVGVVFYPGTKAVSISQDRLLEKEFFNGIGIKTAPFAKVDSLFELNAAGKELGYPLILKTRRLGYDGKGQTIVKSESDAPECFKLLGGKDLIAEGFVKFSRELSIIAVRSVVGETAFYPLNINTHVGGILSKTLVSSELVSTELQQKAEALAQKALVALGYVGVLVIELFETDAGLIVNEMAPRVHNSGHWSIEGANSSQFENHLRAVCSMPLGSTATYGHCAMLNILNSKPDMNAIRRIPGAKLHWYGKEPRPGRKLGHVTFVESSVKKLNEKVAWAESFLHK
jgi:5-(carboxyamino)imidazole ribonucleotide synthase